jgi:DNA-binding XRE family transcriptional regulator
LCGDSQTVVAALALLLLLFLLSNGATAAGADDRFIHNLFAAFLTEFHKNRSFLSFVDLSTHSLYLYYRYKSISLLQISHNDTEVIGMQFRNLRGIREDNDIKQKDVAKYLNVSQNTYSQYETGVISLTAEVLIKLANYYDVSIDYLLDQTDNPKRQK